MKKSKHILCKRFLLSTAVAACFNTLGVFTPMGYAAELNTNLPQEDAILSGKVSLSQPAQPLSAALKALSAKIGLNITFNDALVSGKNAPALNGNMTRKQALQTLLSNTGLEAKLNDTTIYIQRAPQKVEDQEFKLGKMQVRAKRFHEIGPLPGLGLTKEEIPGNVQSISAKQIKESHSLSLTDLMNKKLQSVNVNDYQGNPFMMDVTYRGFTAGPQIGTPQGLSVFLDGIRVNEPFGDVVNWDMIPMNAIAGVDVFPGSNPIFGLNTLGGAFTLKTKDGFNNEGVDAEILAGSYGRKQLQVEGGINNGTFALFGAGNFFLEDGWRQNSPSKVNQFFGKGSYRGEKLDLNLSTLLVQTDLVGNGLLPSQMYEQNRTSVYSSPDTTKNKLQQYQLSSAFQVNDNFSITGQAYRRNSKRHAIGADVFTDYGNTAYARNLPKAADPANGKLAEEYTCLFNSTNAYGLPDYYVLPIEMTGPPTGVEIYDHPYILNGYNSADLPTDALNAALPDAVVASYRYNFETQKNFLSAMVYKRNTPLPPPDTGDPDPTYFDEASYRANFADFSTQVPYSTSGFPVLDGTGFGDYFYSQKEVSPGVNKIYKNFVLLLAPVNQAACSQTQTDNNVSGLNGSGAYAQVDADGNPISIDGAYGGQPGVVQGTPTAVFTDNNINQIVDGASLQLNWNLEQHKFMVGISIDAANADYSNTSQLGFLDANRRAFLAPDLAHPQFTGADINLPNNDFSGSNTTKSIYFSETWTPVKTWHFNASGRYNETQAKNKIAARYGAANFGIGDLLGVPSNFNVCPNGDCTNVPRNYANPLLSAPLDAAETEKFSYYSFNPQFGATWQAKENLNVYANWAKGARTPSVIELGCALDHTLVDAGHLTTDPDGNSVPALLPKSIVENRQCTLPTTLSGDPYLKQIKATTYDIGMRGTIGDSVQWNLGAYQTDLKDDIYFIAAGNSQGFFDNVGKTRRRGIEAGLSGKKDRVGFSLNYGLTEATFQDGFTMLNNDNSSSFVFDSFYGLNAIRVKPGDRMPGVPLHNLNATVSYDLTPKWQVGLTAVAHSSSYVRGNENNQHRVGVTQYRTFFKAGVGEVTEARQPSNNPGTVPGYATFNLQTSYKLTPEWTATMLVNNIFDKEYFSAGRLGRNPFSPSILGDNTGIDRYNHNSNDWLSTNFISPSAPRGVWFSLNWRFDAGKNKVSSDAATATEASEIQRADQPLPPTLNRYRGIPKVEE